MAGWDDDLIEEQINAATQLGKHARLVAGPGTGKTLTMTRRILWLLTENESIEPKDILALTFTRAAAADLKKKLNQTLKPYGIGLPGVSTLHSFALKTIMRNGPFTRLPQPVRIADDFEERWVIIEELCAILNKYVKEIKRLFTDLSADWNELKADSDEWVRNFPNPAFIGAWLEHRKIYGYTLRDELVYTLKNELDEQGERLKLDGPPRYILVDEYQDLNPCDLQVIKKISDLGSEVFCAGDDDQSIYSFRKAFPEGIRRFPEDYSPSDKLELHICQRCCKEILDYAKYVADQDISTERLPKTIIPKSGAEAGIVRVLSFRDEFDEATSIAKLCKWLIHDKGIKPDEIMILVRSDKNRKFSKPIEDALLGADVPVGVFSDPLAIFNEPEAREMLCCIRLLIDRKDSLAWRTILTLKRRGIGSSTYKQVYELAKSRGITFAEALNSGKENPSLIPRTGERLRSKVLEIEELLNSLGVPDDYIYEDMETWTNDEEIGELPDWLSLIAENTIDDDGLRAEVMSIFEKVIKDTGAITLEGILRSLNTSLSIIVDEDENESAEQEKQTGKVSIMTMHQAKGLSSDVVIIAVAEDEYIPGIAKTDREIADERRLLYVSLTRARKYLFITYCNKRVSNTQRFSGKYSKSGRRERRFTQFLSGGPYTPVNGISFVSSLGS